MAVNSDDVTPRTNEGMEAGKQPRLVKLSERGRSSVEKTQTEKHSSMKNAKMAGCSSSGSGLISCQMLSLPEQAWQ